MTKHILVQEKEVEGLAPGLFQVPEEDGAVTQLNTVHPTDTRQGRAVGLGRVCPQIGGGCFPRMGNSFSAKILPVCETKGS